MTEEIEPPRARRRAAPRRPDVPMPAPGPMGYTAADLRLARVYGRAAGLGLAQDLVAGWCRANDIGPERLHALLGILESCKLEGRNTRRERTHTLTPPAARVVSVPPAP